MLRLCVQGVEAVVIVSSFTLISTKDIEIFFDDSTSMTESYTWWITCSIDSLEGLVVGIK